MHTLSRFHICGPLKPIAFFSSACRPGDLGRWSGFNYVRPLSVAMAHCFSTDEMPLLRHLFFQILLFPSETPRKILTGETVVWDILPRKMPVGTGQRASPVSDNALGLRCCGGGWIQSSQPTSLSYLIFQMQSIWL